MNDSWMNESEMMQNSEVIGERTENGDGSQVINVSRNISEVEITDHGYRFE